MRCLDTHQQPRRLQSTLFSTHRRILTSARIQVNLGRLTDAFLPPSWSQLLGIICPRSTGFAPCDLRVSTLAQCCATTSLCGTFYQNLEGSRVEHFRRRSSTIAVSNPSQVECSTIR